jgi:hypothetical protein
VVLISVSTDVALAVESIQHPEHGEHQNDPDVASHGAAGTAWPP